MRVPKISLIIAAFIILFFGCQHAAIAYRLRQDGVLLPPTTADNTSQAVSIAIKAARHETQKTMDCDISENLPLPPAIAYFLELGSYDITGYIDLTRDFRMQVTSPIYRPGSQPSANNLLGYETANYVFVGEGSESRTRLRLASATETPIRGTPFEKPMVQNELSSLKTPAYFRLLFMTEEGTSNRLMRAVFLSARERNKLAQAAPWHGTAPDAFCASLSIGDVNCMVFPKNFGVSPELRIRVNHKDLFVPVGGMVQEALNLPNEADPPSTLRVLRPFHGHLIPIKFDKPSRDILKLVLLPGDQITF
jgi:hypothetical protein